MSGLTIVLRGTRLIASVTGTPGDPGSFNTDRSPALCTIRAALMNLTVPLTGYCLTVLIIMFGGRKRRTFTHATQLAAGMTIIVLCLGAIVWLLSAVISQLINAEN